MKKPLILFLTIISIGIILPSCRNAKSNNATATVLFSSNQTDISNTPSPSATVTSTPSPSSTLIPTTTATFDSRQIITVTPANPAICPPEDPMVTPWFPYCGKQGCSIASVDDVIKYLNLGGTYENLKNGAYRLHYDLTGDGIKEYGVRDFNGNYIVGCNNGKYEVYTELEPIQNIPNLEFVDDLNHNGIPEIYLSYTERHAFSSIHILEWNGEEFAELIDRDGYDFLGGTGCKISYLDTNQDGLLDILATNDVSANPIDKISHFPYRTSTKTIGWNGEHYVLIDFYFDPPLYRFQALQDADYAISMGKIDRAIESYEQVIFDPYLDWWSEKKFNSLYAQNENEVSQYMGKYLSRSTTTPLPNAPPPQKNILEYDQLSAFAYFRLMVIYTVRDDDESAHQQLLTLQINYNNENAGFPYREMAETYWNTYTQTADITNSCAAAIQYAADHPELLAPLGSEYHGLSSIKYKPEDVCPFRTE